MNTKKEGESNGIQFLKYDPPLNWSTVLKRLYEDFKIGSILVEGGASVHKSLLASGNWNALVRDIGTEQLGKGLQAPQIPKDVHFDRQEIMAGDTIEYYSPPS